MDNKLIIVNVRLLFALLTVIGGMLLNYRADPASVFSVLRLYFTGMLILGIVVDIFGRMKLHDFQKSDDED